MEASSPPTQGPAKESDTPTTLALDRGAVTSPLKLARASEAPSDANLGHVALGVACALRVLLCEYETPHGGGSSHTQGQPGGVRGFWTNGPAA